MPFYYIQWTESFTAKINSRGIAPEEIEDVIYDPDDKDISRSSGLPLWSGWSRYGNWVSVIFDWQDQDTVRPVSAFKPGE
jgi:hypothetical protein